jgi:hypothetical protein
VERESAETRLEKDVQNCKKLMGIPIWAEGEVISSDIFPKIKENSRLTIGAIFPLFSAFDGINLRKLITIPESDEQQTD